MYVRQQIRPPFMFNAGQEHSPVLIISLIRLGTVSIFISATYVYGMYPFGTSPHQISRRFLGPTISSSFFFLFKIRSLAGIPDWREATTRPTASRLPLFESRTGDRRLTKKRGNTMEGILLIIISCVSLLGLVSLYWLWRP